MGYFCQSTTPDQLLRPLDRSNPCTVHCAHSHAHISRFSHRCCQLSLINSLLENLISLQSFCYYINNNDNGNDNNRNTNNNNTNENKINNNNNVTDSLMTN